MTQLRKTLYLCVGTALSLSALIAYIFGPLHDLALLGAAVIDGLGTVLAAVTIKTLVPDASPLHINNQDFEGE